MNQFTSIGTVSISQFFQLQLNENEKSSSLIAKAKAREKKEQISNFN